MTEKLHTPDEAAAANNFLASFPRRIVVLGNNVSAWMSATMLARNMQGLGTQVTVVSGDKDERTPFQAICSSATLSTVVSSLGVDEQDMLRSCQGTYRLATRFSNWTRSQDSFLVPVAHTEKHSANRSLYNNWQIQGVHGSQLAGLHQFVAQTSAADSGRSPHSFSGNSPLSDPSQYGYHVDSLKLSAWFRTVALSSDVQELTDKVDHFDRDSEGRSTGIRLTSDQKIPVDVVIDCRQQTQRDRTGDWIDLAARFHTDRIIRQAFKGLSEVPSLTEVCGMEHGWAALVPLHEQVESHYAFSSSGVSDEAALQQLRLFTADTMKAELIDRDTATVSELVHKRCGKFWQHNVIRMGPAAFEIEPLAAVSVHLTIIQIELLLDFLGGCESDSVNSTEYNQRIGSIVDETIDFAELHHVLKDPPKQQTPSPTLQQFLQTYDANGTISLRNPEAPSQLQWAMLLTGAGRIPDRSLWEMRQANEADVERQLRTVLAFNEAAVQHLPQHAEILDWIHSAPLPLEAG